MWEGKSRTWAVLNKPSNKLVCADRAVVQYRGAAGGAQCPAPGLRRGHTRRNKLGHTAFKVGAGMVHRIDFTNLPPEFLDDP